jgi:hypothetical protein
LRKSAIGEKFEGSVIAAALDQGFAVFATVLQIRNYRVTLASDSPVEYQGSYTVVAAVGLI